MNMQSLLDTRQMSVSIRGQDLDYGPVKVLQGLDLEVAKGEFLVLLGSSGCGKSTLLNCIAGLLDLSAGQIFINGENVTWTEPSERGIGMVFQSYALYPQMSVERNMSFGLRNAGMPRAEIAARVAKAAKILQLEPLLKRKPAALSGGQRQRVAIGRALVRDVDVFLFDEPLSNLDAKLRADLRVEIKRLHQTLGNTMIYVTHDQVEAMTLADRIAVMKDGKIMQLGTPDEIYNRPQNLYVADFIGAPAMNFLDADLAGGVVTFGANMMAMPDLAGVSDRRVVMGIRPEHVAAGHDAVRADLVIEAMLDLVEPMGADTLIWTKLTDQLFRVRIDGQMKVQPGMRLQLGLNAATCAVFDKETGQRL